MSRKDDLSNMLMSFSDFPPEDGGSPHRLSARGAESVRAQEIHLARQRLTRIGTPPRGRSVVEASGSIAPGPSNMKSACWSSVASTIGPSISAKWLPMQVLGPALNGI